MKFLKLLDPLDRTYGDITAVGKQQRRAHEEFPKLVEKSLLHYWSLGDPIYSEGTRYLVSLAATYSLPSLRLADVLNESLETLRPTRKWVDVFDILDICGADGFRPYFPDRSRDAVEIIIGVWEMGEFQKSLLHDEGIDYLLHDLGNKYSSADVFIDLYPPDRRLVED